MDQNLCQLMRTKMGIGCWLEMFHGSKFSLYISLAIYKFFFSKKSKKKQNLIVIFLSIQYVHLFMQEDENHERVRS